METLTPQWASYELADSGDGKKLERFDEFILIRPEAQARWKPALPAHQWEAAHGEFVKTSRGQQGEWKFRKPAPKRWTMQRKNLKFWVQPAPSGHVGVFPDQACHWDWIAEATRLAADSVKLLCLFGHTGLAALAAAGEGAQVTHVDASRKAVASARENQSLSGLGTRPIRWIVEDALTFVRREARRGNQYNALVLDPPRFGRGPDGEIWRFEDSLPELLGACARILSTRPVFCSAECLCDGADGGTNGKGRRRTACTPQNDARRIPDSRQRRRVGDPRCGRAKNFRLRFRQGSVGEMIRNATLGPPCQKRAPAEGFNSSKASVLGERKPASRATEASSPRASSSSAILS